MLISPRIAVFVLTVCSPLLQAQVIDFDSALPPGVTVSTSGICHITPACSSPISQENHAYFGFDAGCNFDNGQTVTGSLQVSGLFAPWGAQLSFGLYRQDEGGTTGGPGDWDSLIMTINGIDVGPLTAGFNGDFIVDLPSLGLDGQVVDIVVSFNSVDGAWNDGYGNSLDNFKLLLGWIQGRRAKKSCQITH